MCQVYQEFLYQTTYLSLDMVMDSIIREPGRPSIQQVQTVAKIVPLSQLRKVIFPIVGQPPITNQLTPINSGILYTGIDYYGMLTSQPGARQSILTADGNRGGMRMSFKVDAFEHNGSPIKVANTVRNTTDTNAGTISPDVLQLWAQPSYDNLNLEDQQVLWSLSGGLPTSLIILSSSGLTSSVISTGSTQILTLQLRISSTTLPFLAPMAANLIRFN